MVNRKVIVFDSWTEGSVHMERLVEPFRENGLDLFLLHIGSWGHDLGRPKEERIGPLLTRDIQYYDGLSFGEILKREQPAAVLFFSLQSFPHRAFKRYCVQLGIPTVHVYHGLVGVQKVLGARTSSVKFRRMLPIVLERLLKNVRLMLPVYMKALWQTRAGVRDWGWFGYDVWRKLVGRSYYGPAAPDTITDACCVYTEADVAHAVHRYWASPDSVAVVGNPDLIKMGVTDADMGAALSRESCGSHVVYVETGLLTVAEAFVNEDEFFQQLVTTRDALARFGLRMIVKLHPGHFAAGVPDRLRQRGVEQCTNEDFVALLKTCRAAIAEPSSAAVIPALVGVPLLLAQHGRLSTQVYGDVLTSYPRARYLGSLDEVPGLVDALEGSLDRDAVRTWIRVNAGPLPSHEMPARVARVCQSLVERRWRAQA